MIALIDFLDFQGFMQMPVQKPLHFEYNIHKITFTNILFCGMFLAQRRAK